MKKILLLILLYFISVKAWSIIYWQPYPITATVTSIGTYQRIECSVYDSLLGIWQYYNTPYYNDSILISESPAPVITFETYTHPFFPFDLDSSYGYIIYDQELHQFAPVLTYHSDPDAPGAHAHTLDGTVSIFTQCCFNGWFINGVEAYIYDIKNHTWIGGGLEFEDDASIEVDTGGLVVTEGEDWWTILHYYDPVFNSFRNISLGYLYTFDNHTGGNQDLYYSFHHAMFADEGASFSAYDPAIHTWKSWTNEFADYNDYLIRNDIFYTRNFDTGWNYFGIYDDSLHQWKLDSTNLIISNVIIKDRVVTYTNSNKVYYMAFSPTLRTWVKDSTTVLSGIVSVYIDNGTVKWLNGNGVTKKAGYNDVTGWGNYNTPLLLNFHVTDFYEPLVFVRNYSIGADSVMFDFGDGISTDWHQGSAWHLYKVNGHYVPGTVNYNICISTNTSTGMQTSCQTITQPCYATFNISSNCPGVCNGSIAAITQTGQAPFTFLWSNGATSSLVNSLCAGNYSVTITDSTGCSFTSTLVINPMIVTASTNFIICPGFCNGSANVNVGGAAIPFSYLWSTGDTTGSISNLCTGSYTITVTDGNGCTGSAVATVINPVNPTSLSSYIDQPSCSGFNDGEITYDVFGGIPPFSYSWSPNIGTLDTFFITWIEWYNLPAGIYTLTVTDGYGCSVSNTDTLIDPPPLIAAITPNGPTTFCVGGSVLLTATAGAGYNYYWKKNGSYISGAISQTYLATSAGVYTVRIDSPTFCSETSPPITVTTPCMPPIDPSLKNGIDNSEDNNAALFVFYHSSFQTTFINAQKLRGNNYALHVYDILGKEVFKEEGAIPLATNEGIYNKELNVAVFAKGMYVVSLQTEKEKLIKKFVKE